MDALMEDPRFVTVAAWTGGTFALWAVAYILLKITTVTFKEKTYLAAHNLAHLVPVAAITYYGFLRLDLITQRPETLAQRMYGPDAAAEQICLIQMALQIYVAAAAFGTRDKSLLKPEMLAHHTVTFTLMWLCLHPFAHSYVHVFFGITELSSLPLDAVDTFKEFKHLRTQYPSTDMASKALFSLSFLALRVGLSSQVSYHFQRDLYELYATGQAHSLPAVAFMSISNLFVSGLQLYWGTLVVKNIQRTLFGGGKSSKKKGN